MEGLAGILGLLQAQAQPRPDLNAGTPATFMGRVTQPGETLQDILARFPQGEVESGSLAMEAPSSLASLLGLASPQAIKIANATSRAAGAVGARAVVPRMVEESVDKGASILDYGAGKAAAHAQALKGKGYNVTAHDFGDNVIEGLHDPKALSRSYDHVYASNVLNTQSSPEMLGATLDEIAGAVRPGGSATVNLPASPRKFEGLNAELLESELKKRFKEVKRVGGSKSAPVYKVTKETNG